MFSSKKFRFSPQVQLLESRMQPGSIWFGGGSLLASDLNLSPQQDLADELAADHQRRMPVDTTSSVELVTRNTGTNQTGALVQGSPVQLNHGSVATPSQNPFARSTALDMAAMNHITHPVNASQQANHQASATQGVQQQSTAVAKNNINPTIQSVPLSNQKVSAQVASIPHEAINLQFSKVHMNIEGGPAIPSSPNFSRYVGITNENRLDGIAILQDGSGNLGATGLSQVGSAKSILVATVASDATSGSSGTLTLSGTDATGVGISSDAAGNLYVSATLSTGATNTGQALIQIDPSGNATALVLAGTTGSGGYLRFNAADGLVYFSGDLNGDMVSGTVDSTNWDPTGVNAFTYHFTDGTGADLASSTHSVVLDSVGNIYYAATFTDIFGTTDPGFVTLTGGIGGAANGAFFAGVGNHSAMYDITDGVDPGTGLETIYASGTLNVSGTAEDLILVANVTAGAGVTLGASGAGFNGYGLSTDPATENVYIADNNYATGGIPAANAGWVALDPTLSTIVDQNSDPFDDIFGTFDDRDRGMALSAGNLYMAGFTNSDDFNFLAPSSPAFGGTPNGQYDSIWISYTI